MLLADKASVSTCGDSELVLDNVSRVCGQLMAILKHVWKHVYTQTLSA